jgi:hypothetical protein
LNQAIWDSNQAQDPAVFATLSIENVGGCLSIRAVVAGIPGFNGNWDFIALECTFGTPIPAYRFAAESGSNATFAAVTGLAFSVMDGWFAVLFTDFFETLLLAATDASSIAGIQVQQVTAAGAFERTLTATTFESDPGPGVIQFLWSQNNQGGGIPQYPGFMPKPLIATPAIMVSVNVPVGALVPALQDISDLDATISLNQGAAGFSIRGKATT